MQSLNLLLDTHIVLWAIGKTSELSRKVIHEIKNPDNTVLVSAVSLWEIALKTSIGKLSVNCNYSARKDIKSGNLPLKRIFSASADEIWCFSQVDK
jgi:PIN domain nuclease of toxin-antitoxin system